MEPIKVKFDWENPSIIENKGHNQSEWGKERQLPKLLHTK